jgi:hypothetical protein
MVQWWLRHHGCFVNFDEDHKRGIEDLTGCIPLFLAPFLKLPGETLEMLEPRIWDGVYYQEHYRLCTKAEMHSNTSNVSSPLYSCI